MTPDTHAETDAIRADAALTLDSAPCEMVNIEAGDTPQGPGPGDETVMCWARAM
jgi:hypothetical protein